MTMDRALKENRLLRRKVLLTKTGRAAYGVFHYALLTLLSFILLYPLLYMLSMSLRPVNQRLDPTIVWIPRKLTLDNILKVWGGTMMVSSTRLNSRPLNRNLNRAKP